MKTLASVLALVAASAAAQNLTPSQKETDFRNLVATINTWYALVDWKKQYLGVDALDLKTWLTRVSQTKTDLDFYELCTEYIYSLQDTHTYYELPSNFIAQLGLGADLYDGVALIEGINRTTLRAADYPFAIGDELVSVDGVPAEELIERFKKYFPEGNDRAARRIAAARLGSRLQAYMPHATDVGASASVVIRRQSGALETYTIPWNKTGVPLEVGPVPSPTFTTSLPKEKSAAAANQKPRYLSDLEELQHSGLDRRRTTLGVLNYGSRNPVFINGLGSGFTRRLGGASADFFYSGVFRQDGLNIGFIRIPSYSPSSQTTALQQLDREIAFFQQNTDGLIVDGMRNPGGNLCFGEQVMRRFSPEPFWATGFALRAMYWRVMFYYQDMIDAKANGASPEVIQQWEQLYAAMADANQKNRGVTEPIPICSSTLRLEPAKDASGNITAYTKPMMMLIDEFSTSTGDSVPSMFQESKRGLLYGYRSNGAGGNNTSVPVGPYSEGLIGVTMGVQVKRTPVSVEGYPTTGVIENVGVHPDIVNDYMTKDNLLQGGAPFVRQFLTEMVNYIRSKQ